MTLPSAHKRLAAGLIVVAVVAALLPGSLPVSVRLAAAWDIGVVFFLAFTWWVVEKCPPEGMRQTVLENDQGRVGVQIGRASCREGGAHRSVAVSSSTS